MPPYPFLHPTPYNPGNLGPGSGDLGQLMAMFAGPMMTAMAGQGNFAPHLMPTQAVMDQYAMRAFQNETRQHTFDVGKLGDDRVATSLLGIRAAVTDQPATQLNREQAQNIAGMVNNPFAKALMGAAFGPETVEAMFHGSKGDVSALANSVNKIGYFRADPTGGGRMSAQGMKSYTSGIYNELYEPHGDLDELERETRRGSAPHTQRLKKAARAEQKEIVSDDDVVTRLTELDDSKTRIEQLYKKYVSGGKATDVKQQAQELTKFDRAINEAGVLTDTEMTVGGLKRRAEKMATYDMHGFMAGQIGQLAEDMFQRGKLPQAIGSMSAADRVKLIQSSGRDEETMDKLARDYGHRELMKDTEYRGKTAEGQKQELESKLDTFKGTLRGTFDELDKAQKGERGAKSVEELEQLAGMDLMAGNVDAKRSASAIKDMTGAVAAVREIFGDNGNPNAPMPALLAALEQLTQGAGSQVSGGKVEAALRQMQTLAKETGVGFEQLAGLSANMGAMGDMLGVAKGTTMQSTVNVLATTKAMRDTGAFSKQFHGAMSQEEAMQNVAEREMRGNASSNAMGMATLKALYDASPEKYAGSEMEAAIKAYSDPNSDGTYTDPKTGETKNIKEVIGKGGIQAAGEMFERAGGTQSQFSTTYYDPRTKQHVRAGFGFATQKYEAARDINMAETSNAVHSSMSDYIKDNAGSEFAKMSDNEREQLSVDAGAAITDMIIETSDMKEDEQLTYMQQNLEGSLVDVFKKRGHADPAAAAKEAAAAIITTDPKEQRAKLQTMIAGANAFYGFQTGGKVLGTLKQTSGKEVTQKTEEEQRTTAAAAARRARFGGQESGPIQRLADYAFEIGESGENFTVEGMSQALLGSIPDSEVRQRYAAEMTGGFNALQKATRQASITNKDVDAIAASGDIKKLRELAGMKTDPKDKDYVQIYSAAEMETKRKDAVAAMDDAAIKKAYETHIGGATGLTTAQQRKELETNTKFKAEVDSKLLKPGEMTIDQAAQRAKDTSVGTAKTDADKARLEDLAKIRTSFFKGEDEDKIRAGVSAAVRQFGALGVDDDKMKKLQALVLQSGDAAKAELQKELDTMSFASKEHRADFTEIVMAQQAGRQIPLERAGFRPETDAQLTPTPHAPTPQQRKPAATAPGAGAGAPSTTTDRHGTPAGKKQTWAEWLLGLPGTKDVQQKTDDAPLATKPEQDTPEIAALKQERAAIEDPMTADDAYMAREEAEYASAKKDAVARGRADVHGAKEKEELAQRKQFIVAQRVAKKMGLSVRGKHEHQRIIDGITGQTLLDEHRLDGKVLDPKLMREGLDEFDAAEQQQAQFPETGASPLSPEAQKMAALDEKIAEEKKKQQAQQAAAEQAGVAAKNDEALQQQAGLQPGEKPAAAAQIPPATQYDIDPGEFKLSVSQKEGSYISIDGPFRDQQGKPIDRPTQSEYFDAMHVVDRAKDDKQGRTGRVGQIGEKYYEEYRVPGGPEAWREVTVGKNEPKKQTDGAPATAAMPDKAAPDAQQTPAADSQQTASTGDSIWTSLSKKVAQAAGAALGVSMPEPEQATQAASPTARHGVAAAQTVAVSSRNVTPGAAGQAGAKDQPITIKGTLSLQGLNEAILNSRGTQPIQAEGSGAAIVMDSPRTPIDNFAPQEA